VPYIRPQQNSRRQTRACVARHRSRPEPFGASRTVVARHADTPTAVRAQAIRYWPAIPTPPPGRQPPSHACYFGPVKEAVAMTEIIIDKTDGPRIHSPSTT
jgi:hypothetical protein